MNPQAFKTLEFDSLRALVRRRAQTDLARLRIEQLVPLDEFAELQRELQRLSELIELRQRGVRLSFEAVADPSDSISHLKIAGTALDPLAMLDLARLMESALDARAAIHTEREKCPALFEIVAPLSNDLKKLAATLTKKILPGGELDDRASPELASIRRELFNARSRITRSLESLMRRSSEAIQEELVTVRNDRFVIPVRSDHQARIKGVAHGSSSSGATVFVEPLETIEANNELQTLREAEQREIGEILFSLSEELRHELAAIAIAASAISELDFVNAKASFAEAFDCVVPDVSEPGAVAAGSDTQVESHDPAAFAESSDPVRSDPVLEFINARHPLLEENLRASAGTVVPVSFTLDRGHPVMVISGANAGGKTVVLKTAGLLALMARAGLPVPAQAARVPFYRSILADIGDHQSLAANLSTFTSHVANIGSMIALCEAPALVLLDEVGTGTDPEEGSALGVAVVDHFKKCGAQVLATTHYSGLKMYAANEPGVLNASVEFDEKTLQPTYRLLVGLAGSSSGLEIARRFGIPAEVIGRAIEQVSASSRASIEYLRRIKSEAEEAEALRKALDEERVAVAEKFAAIDEQAAQEEASRQSEFERELSRAVKAFEEHSHDLVAKIEDRASRLKLDREAARRTAELKREAQLTAQAVRKTGQAGRASSQRKEGSSPLLRGVRVIRDGQVVSDLPVKADKTKPIQHLDGRPERQDIRGPERDLKVGDRVRLLSLGSVGIINHIREDEAEVRVGSLRMREKLENLELVYEVSTASKSPRGDGVNTVRGSGRGGRPTVSEGSLGDLRRRAGTTEVHLHSGAQRHSDSGAQTELKLIGKKTDEAVDLTDKFLDEAFLNGLSEVRIIHGHGTGALRKAIAALLADHPHVSRFAVAPQDQGGGGATIVELRQ
ncbi:MAG: endonuclease MutS2 [Pyrinomonadaceae bacterium]